MLNNNLIVKIPHNLTQQEAAQRLKSGIEQMKERYGDRVTSFDLIWESENRLVGQLQALGAKVSGSIDVLPQEVTVTIQLPWLLAMLKDKISGFVTRRGSQLLLK